MGFLYSSSSLHKSVVNVRMPRDESISMVTALNMNYSVHRICVVACENPRVVMSVESGKQD